MFQNIRFPVRFREHLLQAKWLMAANEFCPFFLNTTVGFLGFADVAVDLSRTQHKTGGHGADVRRVGVGIKLLT